MMLEMKLFDVQEAVTAAEAAEAKLSGEWWWWWGETGCVCADVCVGAYVCLCVCVSRFPGEHLRFLENR